MNNPLRVLTYSNFFHWPRALCPCWSPFSAALCNDTPRSVSAHRYSLAPARPSSVMTFWQHSKPTFHGCPCHAGRPIHRQRESRVADDHSSICCHPPAPLEAASVLASRRTQSRLPLLPGSFLCPLFSLLPDLQTLELPNLCMSAPLTIYSSALPQGFEYNLCAPHSSNFSREFQMCVSNDALERYGSVRASVTEHHRPGR